MYNVVKAVFNFATLLNGCTILYMHAYMVEIIGFKVKRIGYVYSVRECVGEHVYLLWCILGRHIEKAKAMLHVCED